MSRMYSLPTRWDWPGHARDTALMLGAIACLPVSAALAKSVSIREGAKYVAMGSSYAAGPGITVSADTPANRCQRSADNYAHLLARRRQLLLVDVSCGGATTAHVLGPWGELPAQIDAVTPDTALVTITIGGNDVGFAGGLIVGSCGMLTSPVGIPAMCKGINAMRASNPQTPIPLFAPPTEITWHKLATAMDQIAREVHRRAPKARLVFVDYIRVLPDPPLCGIAPLTSEAAQRARTTGARLAQITLVAAQHGDAGLVRASDLSQGHEVCTNIPWVTGFIAPPNVQNFTPYHPNLAAMNAIADALDRQIDR